MRGPLSPRERAGVRGKGAIGLLYRVTTSFAPPDNLPNLSGIGRPRLLASRASRLVVIRVSAAGRRHADEWVRAWLQTSARPELKPRVALAGALANACLMQAFAEQLAGLKEKLLTMASHAESSVYKVIEALGKRDYDLAQRIEADDKAVAIRSDEGVPRASIRAAHDPK